MNHALVRRRETAMIRISIPYMAGVFTALENVDLVKDADSVMDGWFRLFEVQQQVETLLNQSVFAAALRSSRLPAQTFLEAVKAILSEQELISQIGPARIWL